MSDDEFLDFRTKYHSLRQKVKEFEARPKNVMHSGNSLITKYKFENGVLSITTKHTTDDEILGPVWLEDNYGRWALQLRSCGLLEDIWSTSLSVEQHESDPSLSISNETTVTLCPSCLRLNDLIERSIPVDA